MGARSIASVLVSFGMVNIGVKIFLSAKSEQVSFHMINSKTGNRLNQILVDSDDFNPEDKSIRKTKVVPRNETLRGFEYQKGQYVTFTDEEIADMQADKSNSLDIKEFIPSGAIDPISIEKTFYLNPDKGHDKGYALLAAILKQEGKVAVGTWVAKGKEHLVVIKSYQDGLIMHQMFYDNEVRSFQNTCRSTNISSAELAMAKMIVDQFSKDSFDKSQYSDKFIDKVNKAVNAKLKGNDVVKPKAKVASSNMEDGLRASLLALKVPKSKINSMLKQAKEAASSKKISRKTGS